MTTPQLLSKEKYEYAVKVAIATYDRQIKLIVDQSTKPDGRLTLDEQAKVRYLESKKRGVQRWYNFTYGTGKAHKDAVTETLVDLDDGTLVQLGEKLHGRGRLDCRACDSSFEGMQPTRFSKLCTQCKRGIMHVYTLYPSDNKDTQGIRVFHCESCTAKEQVKVDLV
jgi:hypothetical protein